MRPHKHFRQASSPTALWTHSVKIQESTPITNVYTYVKQNPWTKFDPEGLFMGFDSAGEYFHEVGNMWKGYGLAAKDTVTGLYQVGRHPIDTAKGLGNAVMHPVDTAHAVANSVSDTWNSGNEGKGRVIGNALIAVASVAAPAAEASNVAKVAEVANAANKAAAAGKIASSAADVFIVTKNAIGQITVQIPGKGAVMGAVTDGNLWIDAISVGKNFRGQGVSKMLYQKIIEEAGGDAVKLVQGFMKGDNSAVLKRTGDIAKTPRAKALEQAGGFKKHQYDKFSNIGTSTR